MTSVPTPPIPEEKRKAALDEITIMTEHQLWYKKIKNGCWRVFKGDKLMSEHSMEKGAQEAIKLFLRPAPPSLDEL